MFTIRVDRNGVVLDRHFDTRKVKHKGVPRD